MSRGEDQPEETPQADAFSDEQWDKKVSPLLVLGPSMESLLRSLLSVKNIDTHSIEHRVKKRSSVVRKIEDKNRDEYGLDSLTDILGVRIITYFDQEVDDVAKVVEEEFGVDRENSVDKRKALDPDRFGYLSLHYVVQLNGARSRLAEYREYKAIKFEIQIRSILQHAWAEIEHDLGYKSRAAIPAPIRRQFSRLAGLLELADIEFTNIRKDMATYERSVEQAVDDNEFGEGINRESITAYIKRSVLLRRLEEDLASKLGRDRASGASASYVSARVAGLKAVGISSLLELDEALKADGALLVRFVNLYFHRKGKNIAPQRPMPQGLLLHYLVVSKLLALTEAQFKKRAAQARIRIDSRDMYATFWQQALGSSAES